PRGITQFLKKAGLGGLINRDFRFISSRHFFAHFYPQLVERLEAGAKRKNNNQATEMEPKKIEPTIAKPRFKDIKSMNAGELLELLYSRDIDTQKQIEVLRELGDLGNLSARGPLEEFLRKGDLSGVEKWEIVRPEILNALARLGPPTAAGATLAAS